MCCINVLYLQVASEKKRIVGYLLDTKGPEVRTAMLRDGKDIELVAGRPKQCWLRKEDGLLCREGFVRVRVGLGWVESNWFGLSWAGWMYHTLAC